LEEQRRLFERRESPPPSPEKDQGAAAADNNNNNGTAGAAASAIKMTSPTTITSTSSSPSDTPSSSTKLDQLRNSRRTRETQLLELVQGQTTSTTNNTHNLHNHNNLGSMDATDVMAVIVNLKDELMAAHEVIQQQRIQIETLTELQTNERSNHNTIDDIIESQPEVSSESESTTATTVPLCQYQELQARFTQLQLDRAWGEFRLRDRITSDALKFHRRLRHWKEETETLQCTLRNVQNEWDVERNTLQRELECTQQDLQEYKTATESTLKEFCQANERIDALERELEHLKVNHNETTMTENSNSEEEEKINGALSFNQESDTELAFQKNAAPEDDTTATMDDAEDDESDAGASSQNQGKDGDSSPSRSLLQLEENNIVVDDNDDDDDRNKNANKNNKDATKTSMFSKPLTVSPKVGNRSWGNWNVPKIFQREHSSSSSCDQQKNLMEHRNLMD